MGDPLNLGKDGELYTVKETRRAYDQEIIEETTYSCSFCAETFPDREAARRHMEKQHLGQVFGDG